MKVRTTVEVAARVEAATVETAAAANAGEAAAALQQMGASTVSAAVPEMMIHPAHLRNIEVVAPWRRSSGVATL